jgi:hypothetical protein
LKKRFKFEMGGMYVYYFGDNLGKAIAEFIKHRPTYLDMVETITEEPIKDYERP